MHRRHALKTLGAGLAVSLAAPRAFAAPQGRWLRLETPNFIAFSADDEGRARGELSALEAFNGLLEKLMPSSRKRSPLKLALYFTGSAHDFEMTGPGFPPSVAGFYTAGLEEIRAVVAQSRGREKQYDIHEGRAFDARLILFHEYVHHFMYANMRAAYPAWYVEGFADFLATAQFTNDGVYLGKGTPARATWLAAGEWMDINRLLTKHPYELSETDTAIFYAEAWLATHYLFNKPERAQGFDRYVRALTAGGDPIGSFESAFGVTPAAFDKELRAYRGGGIAYRLMPGVKIDPNISTTSSRLSPGADDSLLPGAFLRERPDKKMAGDALKAVRMQAKKTPDDPFAQKAAACGEIWFGELDAARRLIDAALTAAPKDAETRYFDGLCELRAGYAAKDEARVLAAASRFALAQQFDPTRAAAMFRYVECRAHGGEGFDEPTLNVLIAAYQLAPQVDVVSLVLAQGLMAHKRFEEAVTVLRPLAADVHGGESSKAAADLIANALAGKSGDLKFYGAAAG